MRKLGELQLKSSASQKVRLLISKQIELWEKNLENFQVDLFRNRCYLCALTNDRDLPNPKDLLSQASPTTKATLHKLGAFTPCSFYACIAARRRRIDRPRTKFRLANTSLNESQSETKCYLTMPMNFTEVRTTDRTILQLVTCDSNPQMVRVLIENKIRSLFIDFSELLCPSTKRQQWENC